MRNSKKTVINASVSRLSTLINLSESDANMHLKIILRYKHDEQLKKKVTPLMTFGLFQSWCNLLKKYDGESLSPSEVWEKGHMHC